MNIENLKTLQSKMIELEKTSENIKTKKTEFDKIIESEVLLKKNLELEIETVKKVIEEEALKEYKETKNKKLDGGIGIKVMNTLTYAKEDAFKWAKEHNLCLLFDDKSFETLASTQDLDFFTKSTNDKVTFPKVIKLENREA
jgi:hypothetical protein